MVRFLCVVIAFGCAVSYPCFSSRAQSGVEPTAPSGAVPQALGEDITVTGRRQAERSDVSRQASQITPRKGNPRRNPLARFEKPVCPGVMGMPEQWAEHLVGRMRHVASMAGMTLARENVCSPNILVVVVADVREGMTQVEKAFPVMFRDLSRRERRDVLSASGPVAVVTASSERTRDGFEIPPRRGASSPPVVSVPLAFSHIYLTTREDIESVILLVEARATDGMSIVQLADYAAMRSFAETHPPAADILAMDTILTLFEPGISAPAALTDFDLAYLRSLYDGIANMPASTRLLGLNRQLRLMSEEAAGADEP